MSLVAVCWHQLGEDAGNNGPEEGERGADDGDVTFGGGPVGGAYVAVWVELDEVFT